jgi:NADPH:quinone reductase-like Zn-dependent oxidoreductase/acyl carrier protein
VRKPATISFAEAAGLPTAYLTAYHSLCGLAPLKAGDRVLIHAAAGGVGQAALQLAKLAGAEVYATASPAKWPLLRAQGVEHIMNSRTVDFAEEVLGQTGGRGVDVVLNSLNKDFIPAGLSCLADGGSFIELGKIGAWSPEQVRAQRPDVRYHNFDLSELPEAELHQLTGRILRAVCGLIEAGDIGPVPASSYSLDETEEAFSLLSRGASTGKLVLSFDGPAARPASPVRLCPDETYLITGGLGALGRQAARKLAAEGARSLALASRSAPADGDLADLAAELGSEVELTVCQADISDERDVAAMMAKLSALGKPLGGVIHAAGVLADAPVASQTWDSIDKVFQAKVYGTWLLHQATATLPGLRFFVGYSSITAVLGWSGQSNYAGGNAFLDTLMQWRAAHGMPGLSVNWGPWAQAGMAAAMSDRHRRGAESRGLVFISPDEGARMLFKALALPPAQVIAGEFNWAAYAAGQPLDNALLHRVVPGGRRRGPAPAVDLAALKAMTKGDREAGLRALLQEKIAGVLRYDSAGEIGAGATFAELGLDSLAAVELKNALEAGLGIGLPTSALYDYPAIGPLAGFLGERLAEA